MTTALPTDDFAYGISRTRDEEGAREGTYSLLLTDRFTVQHVSSSVEDSPLVGSF